MTARHRERVDYIPRVDQSILSESRAPEEEADASDFGLLRALVFVDSVEKSDHHEIAQVRPDCRLPGAIFRSRDEKCRPETNLESPVLALGFKVISLAAK